MTKILVVSDEESKYIWDHFEPKKFKSVDIIISCGDLKPEYLSFLVSVIHAPLYYVHGNHDLKYNANPPEGCESIEDKIVAYKGIRIMGLGGSYRYSPGEFQYSERQMKWRITKLRPRLWLNKGVDILVTHAPAYKIGDGEDCMDTNIGIMEETKEFAITERRKLLMHSDITLLSFNEVLEACEGSVI